MAASPSPSDISSTANSPRQRSSPFRDRGSWSRSGCLTCKKRRKKCDERKPKCDNCTRLRRDCEGYATLWIPPLSTTTTSFQQNPHQAKRRKISENSRNAETVHLPSSAPYQKNHLNKKASFPSSQSTPGPMSTVEDQHRHTIEDTSQAIEDDLHIVQSSGCQITRPLSILQAAESFYMNYHIERGSQLLSNLEVPRNPLNEVLIPRALSSPLLLNALCTLSASHMSNWDTFDRDTLRKAELTYYGKTISGIRNGLVDLSHQVAMSPSYVSLLEELIAAIASLCKYESVRGSVRSWRGHLEALQRLVASCGGLANLDEGIADWLSGLLTYWQYMANIIKPGLKSQLLFCESIYKRPKVDIYLGCSEQIVKICSRIADLRGVDGFQSLKLEIIGINDYLSTWSCREQPFIIPQGITEAAFERLEIVANCFRYAAFIFLHSTLDRMAWPSHQFVDLRASGARPTMWDSVHSLISLTKREAVQALMALLHSHPPDEHSEYSALTFPLFIAGCECEGNSVCLSSVLGALRTLQMNFGVRNTRRAQEFIEGYWEPGSATCHKRHWLDLLEDMDWDLLLV